MRMNKSVIFSALRVMMFNFSTSLRIRLFSLGKDRVPMDGQQRVDFDGGEQHSHLSRDQSEIP